MCQKKWVALLSCFLLTLLVVALAPGALAEADSTAAVESAPKLLYAKNDVRLLSSAKRSAKPVSVLERGAPLDVLEMIGPWAVVAIDDVQGFLYKDELSYSDPLATNRVFTTKPIYMHASPKLNAKILSALPDNFELKVLGTADNWTFVEFSGKQGYVSNKWVSRHANHEEALAPVAPGDKGEDVKALQKRLQELGYLRGSVDGSYMDMTKLSIEEFQKAALLPETGEADEETIDTLFLANAPFNEHVAGPLQPATGKVVMADWWNSGISSIFARGDTAVVTDVYTGISWRIWRGGGTNHADVQPYTADDTANMRKATGGWSWARRPIWVSVDGVRYAASMNCMNHGQGSIKNNNFDGHFCVHFKNSRTHGGNRKCPVHQSCVQEAFNTGNKQYERELALKKEQQAALQRVRESRKLNNPRNDGSSLITLGTKDTDTTDPLSSDPEKGTMPN